jgi:hypothetical protein
MGEEVIQGYDTKNYLTSHSKLSHQMMSQENTKEDQEQDEDTKEHMMMTTKSLEF